MIRQLKITSSITNRYSIALDKYLQEIERIPRISPDEECELSVRIRNGDRKAYDTLVNANLRFVVSVAKKYQNFGLQLGDLINEGNRGLMQAAERFDETKGMKFISYAVWWIRQAILKALSEFALLIKIPPNKRRLVTDVRDATDLYLMEHECEPTDEELAFELNLSVQEIKAGKLLANTKHISFDAPLPGFAEESALSLLDTYKSSADQPDVDTTNESEKNLILRVLKHVVKDSREYYVLASVYGIDNYEQLQIEQVAYRLGITQARAHQIKKKAERRIRCSVRVQKLLLRA